MRTPLVLVALTLAALLGCAPEPKDAAVLDAPQRDLTLAAPAPELEAASPVELQRIEASRPRLRRSAKPKTKAISTAAVPRAPITPPTARLARFASTEYQPVNDRELPPGKTVTMIPVSSGPSTGEWAGDCEG